MAETFEALMTVLRQRQADPHPGSYTARLLAGDERLLEEMADLIYHLSVLLIARDLAWSDVEGVLASRAG